MAPVTRSRAAATSTSPLFQRMKAEAKKDYEMHGKKRREAMPAAIRSSARKSAASKSNVSTSHATTPCITSSKRKHDAIEEEEEATTIKKQKMSHNKQTSAEKRKRAEEVSGEEKEDAPVREIKKLRSTASKQKMAKKDSEENAYEVVSRSTIHVALAVSISDSMLDHRSRLALLHKPLRLRRTLPAVSNHGPSRASGIASTSKK